VNRQAIPITSRQYRIALNSTSFGVGRDGFLAAAGQLRTALVESIEKSRIAYGCEISLLGEFETLKEKKQASIEYFDTRDRRLRNSGLSFQRRCRCDRKSSLLLLTKRHYDRCFVAGCWGGRKTTLEEEIAVTYQNEPTLLYALTTRIKTQFTESRFDTLEDVAKIFEPFQNQLEAQYCDGEQVMRVCNFTGVQTVIEGVKIRIGNKRYLECALIIICNQVSDTQSPVIVELSMRHKKKQVGDGENILCSEAAKKCIDICAMFRDWSLPLAYWVNPKYEGKRQFAYSYSRH